MARRRARPNAESYLINAAAVAVIAIAFYFARLAVLEYVATQQIKQIEATLQQAQAQQQRQLMLAQQKKAADAQAARLARQQYEEQALRQAIEDRVKNVAWDRYYHDPEGCDNWRTDAQMVKCLTYKTNEKNEFDRRWAAGEFRGASLSRLGQ